jgi:polyphosphate kinase
VRGVCALRPGLPGVSENIRVRSVVGRFLEHSRVFWFENAGRPQLYLSSADWMERNLFRRVEVAFPVLNAKLRHRIRDDLERYLKDTSNAWLLGSDGQYRRALEGGAQALAADDAAPADAQAQLLEAYAAAARLPE